MTESGLTIGAVAHATGIPANTLRTWERRYGVPKAARTDGGQRIYAPDVVPHLRLVARALDLGHRPKQALAAPRAQLEAWVNASAPTVQPARTTPAAWIDATRNLDAGRLDGYLHRAWAELGGMGFVAERAAPYIQEIGDAWSSGELKVYHEHFATERLRSFLVDAWRPLADHNEGPRAVLAALPDEEHVIGLHLVATVLSLYGWRPLMLGANTPVTDIIDATVQAHARGVFLSVSQAANPGQVADEAAELRAHLPTGTEVVMGGRGAPTPPKGVLRLETLEDLSRWARG